ncbi:MAG TPA: thioredoxin domain-containing protein, partial [Terracidiphilus sp.]
NDSAPKGETPRVNGTLDDYAFTIHACIDAWFASGRMEYYQAAVKLADAMIARFYDHTGGAFYDTAKPEQGTVPLGALSARRKPLQDAPTPAGNPTVASALLRLEALSGKAEYREIAEDTLTSFAGIVEHFGLYAGSYGLALERFLLDPVEVVVVGSGPEAARLEAMAVARYAVNKTVTRIGPWRLVAGGIPDALAEMLLKVPVPENADVWAMVCRGRTCLPPITDSEEILKALAEDTIRGVRLQDGAGI